MTSRPRTVSICITARGIVNCNFISPAGASIYNSIATWFELSKVAREMILACSFLKIDRHIRCFRDCSQAASSVPLTVMVGSHNTLLASEAPILDLVVHIVAVITSIRGIECLASEAIISCLTFLKQVPKGHFPARHAPSASVAVLASYRPLVRELFFSAATSRRRSSLVVRCLCTSSLTPVSCWYSRFSIC